MKLSFSLVSKCLYLFDGFSISMTFYGSDESLSRNWFRCQRACEQRAFNLINGRKILRWWSELRMFANNLNGNFTDVIFFFTSYIRFNIFTFYIFAPMRKKTHQARHEYLTQSLSLPSLHPSWWCYFKFCYRFILSVCLCLWLSLKWNMPRQTENPYYHRHKEHVTQNTLQK